MSIYVCIFIKIIIYINISLLSGSRLLTLKFPQLICQLLSLLFEFFGFPLGSLYLFLERPDLLGVRLFDVLELMLNRLQLLIQLVLLLQLRLVLSLQLLQLLIVLGLHGL